MVPHELQRAQAWYQLIDEAYPVLADGGFAISAAYGVAFQMRVHTDISNAPGAFLIDREGVIRFARIGTGPKNFRDRPSVEELLTLIDDIDSGSALG